MTIFNEVILSRNLQGGTGNALILLSNLYIHIYIYIYIIYNIFYWIYIYSQRKRYTKNLEKFYQTSNDYNLVNNEDKNMFKNKDWCLKCLL